MARDGISEAEISGGTRDLMWDAAFATVVGVFASGVVLAAFALHKGASNGFIGLLAALPFLTQLLQAPTVRLVERLRARRRIATVSLLAGRLMLLLFPLAALAPSNVALWLILIGAAAHFGSNAVAACAWNSWIRDLIPAGRLGAFFAQRSLYATGVTAVGGLAAGIALELGAAGPGADRTFAVLFMLAFICGLVSVWRLACVPEPAMPRTGPGGPLHRQLLQPLTDTNFRRVIVFGGLWQFAVNFSTPFFTVYFLRDVGLGMGSLMSLTVVSQIANLAMLRLWGGLSDRFSNKSVLLAAAPTFLACLAAIALTRSITAPAPTMAYLMVLHVLMGAASAGIGIATGNIVMKLAPAAHATPYLGANALITAFAAGLAPILGGALADEVAARRLLISVEWVSPRADAPTVALAIGGWEFYFIGAALIGLLALHRLALVREEGEIEGRELMQHVLLQARRTVVNLSPVAGLRIASIFPAGALIDLRRKRSGRSTPGEPRTDQPS